MTQLQEALDLPELTAELPARLAAQRPRIAVIGDVMLDEWLHGSADRLCREGPAPVVDVAHRSIAAGGAANTAVNLAALGADVRLVSAVGADRSGEELLSELRSAGAATGFVAVRPDRHTTTKRRVVAADQLLLRLDDGDHDQPPLPDPAVLRPALAGCAAAVVCDYGSGLLAGGVAAALDELRADIPLLVVDAHRPQRWARLRPDLVTPNAAEAESLLGSPIPKEPEKRPEFLAARRSRLREATGARLVVVTLDRDGAVLLDADLPAHRTWAHPVPDNHTAGAGDTFCAAVTVGLCCGLPPVLAVELAQAAADVVVHRPGTSVCGAAELSQRLASYHGTALDHAQLASVVAAHRAAGRRIVFTNGCFDVLHRGHVTYLNEAKRLGDVLIVALNSDGSVARLKGPGRPVNDAADRAAVVAALSCVDHVTMFDEDTAVGLIEALTPDVYAKGGDHHDELLAEAPAVRRYGGEVRILDYVPDRSTSATIERIRGGGR
jgi:D-beta-D-heptose 7-phosphate kinase / D-beta-D-heptose 1-phosphate adenosyltransferase